MNTYQFDFTVITEGDTEGDAMEEAMQLLADYRFAKEAATVTLLEPRYGVQVLMAGNDSMFSDIEVTLWAVVDQISDPEQAQIIMAMYADHKAAIEDAAGRNIR